MKAVDEIVENWEVEQYNDWYAVDSYLHGKVTRLFVGDEQRAMEYASEYITGANLVDAAGEPAAPGWDGEENTPFYRFLLIGSDEAKAYFDGIMEELTDWITRSKAAELIGVTRGRITQMVDEGKLDTLGKLVSRTDVDKYIRR